MATTPPSQAQTPRTEENEDEYELTLFGRIVIPLGGLLVRIDGGSEPSDVKGWASLVKRLLRRFWLPLVGAAAALVVAAAVVVYFVTRTPPNPNTTAAAKLVLKPSTGHPPAVADPQYLALSYSGVKFPNYTSMHAVATGQLSNKIDGRDAMTVFYRFDRGPRFSYTVFSGPAGRPPAGAHVRVVYFGGVGLKTYHAHGLNVVTVARQGRTTVTASSAPQITVLTLAAAPVVNGSNQSSSGCATCG
jgi:hypothetical protein